MVKTAIGQAGYLSPFSFAHTFREYLRLKWQLFIQEASNSQRTIFNPYFIVRFCLYEQKSFS
jgi:hypothetical protein